jgi:hypothetical protein
MQDMANKSINPQNQTFQQLLSLKISDLNLNLNNSFVAPLIKKVLKELKQKGFKHFIPHFWISDEWFCPDGVPGIAVPFYLTHPKLIELERDQIKYVEGETRQWCLKLIRHEVGHAIDNAYELRKNRQRQQVFGLASTAYPSKYSFLPYSKNFVRHLEDGYAQSHPTEDFAETFAVWLDPESNWKEKYKIWPCLKKLEFLDNLMNDIKNQPLKIKNNIQIAELKDLNTTLTNHYRKKKKTYRVETDNFWDKSLTRIFCYSNSEAAYPKASSFIKQYRKVICDEVAQETGHPIYLINSIVNNLLQRTVELDLHLKKKEALTLELLCDILIKRKKQYLNEGRDQIPL